jgi:hypothetical protein
MPKRNYGLPEVTKYPPLPGVLLPKQDAGHLYCPAIQFHSVYGRVEDVETNVNVLLGMNWKLFGTPFAYKDGIIQSMVLLPSLPEELDIVTDSGDGC